MQIVILAVGRKLSPEAQKISDDYSKRLKYWADVQVCLLAPSKASKKAAVQDESQRIMEVLKTEDYVVLLDERGVQYANLQFSNHLAKVQQYMKRMVIVIGGAYGVSDDLRQRAQMVWSLSSLVFPHELVRIITIEQLYRSFAILHNHPYHHD